MTVQDPIQTETNTAPSNWLSAENRHDSGVYSKHQVVMVSGKGSNVWDENGREYIDCVGGYGVATIGHSHPDVVQAIRDQADTLLVMPQSLPNDKRAEFLTELVSVLPEGLDRVFLCNSGTEAMEAAKKFAITATGRHHFVSMKRGFSGRSLGALALTWEPKYREPFGRRSDNKNVSFMTYGDIEALRAAIDRRHRRSHSGTRAGRRRRASGHAEFIRAARQITREKGALLIMDEIQTGFCRTGKMFAVEHFCAESCQDADGIRCGCQVAENCLVKPDGMTLAKAMAGGVPIGAFVMTGEVADKMPKGGHGTTFGGNPLSMAAGVAAIRAMKNEGMAEQARVKGNTS